MLRVGVSPWSHLNPECYPTSKTGCAAGVELDLLEEIAAMEGLQINITVINEPGCGKTPFETGSSQEWTGLFQMLRENKIDITGNLCNLNKLSQLSQDFFLLSRPVWQFHGQFVIQALKSQTVLFSPFAPLSWLVWIAYLSSFFTFAALVCFYSYVRYGSVQSLAARFSASAYLIAESCCGFVKNLSFEFIWPLWFLLMGSMIIFYDSYILSAVLHPFPVLKPMSNLNQFSEQLLSGKYRLLTYRSPPSVPVGCSGPCKSKFQAAIAQHGYKHVPNATGAEFLSAIADQNPEDESKLVLLDGMPFVNMYLSEYFEKRDRLWIIDEQDGSELWSAYVWRKDFEYAEHFNRHLGRIGDYKFNALNRYIRPIGAKPHTEDRIYEKGRRHAIKISEVSTLFYFYFGGLAGAGVLLLVERVWSRCKSGQSRVTYL